MYTLFRTVGFRKALEREITPLAMSLLIAELFFKFHSFVLECVAFLATWHVLSWAGAAALRSIRSESPRR